MSDLLELAVSAAASGSIYALIALGYLLILRPTGIINFAVGEWAMIGAFLGVAVLTDLLLESFSLTQILAGVVDGIIVAHVLGVLIVLLLMALVGWWVERLTVRPLVEKGVPVLSPILALLGVLIIFREVGATVGGTEALPTDPPFGFGRVEIAGFAGSPQSFYVIGATIAVFVGVWLFFERTVWGKAFEAVALDRRAAALMGINLKRVTAMAFAAAAAVCAFAGVLVSGQSGAFYLMGLPLAVQGFTALVIGGVGRVEGAYLGGMLLGFTEALTTRYLDGLTKSLFGFGFPSELALGVPLALLIAFLLVRPTGILPAKGAA